MNTRRFFSELKRRNVYKVAVGYAVVGWLVMQVAVTIVPALHLPDSLTTAVVVLTLLGFPFALVIAWAFEMTPDGMKRTENVLPGEHIPQWSRQKFAAFILVVGLVAAGLLFFQLLRPKGAKTSPPSAKSIAVLPFTNLSEEKTNAYFADGIQDEILTRLSKIAELKVISRTSTQQFQSKPGNIAEIAKQLGVAHILEGSVQKVNDSVRVNVQLIKAEGDSHLWAETYDRKLLDVFAVESEVAQRIASSLEATLTGREKHELARAPTQNSEAYDAFLRGLALDNSQGDELVEEARKYFRRAVELDPQFALAWAYLANREAWKYFAGDGTPAQLAIAKEATDTAMRLHPDSSEAHAAAGSFYYYCQQDFERALQEFERAHELSPSYANAITMTAMVKRRQGKIEESIRLQLEAAVLDPRNPDIWVNLGRSHRGLRHFEEARAMFDRALALLPNDKTVVAEKIETWLGEGDLKSADKALAPLELTLGTWRLFRDYISLLAFRREFERAIAAFSERLDGADPEEARYARLGIAFQQVMAGNLAAAKSALEETRHQLEEQRRQGDRSREIGDLSIDIAAALGDRAAVDRQSQELLRATEHDLWRLGNSEETIGRAYASLGDASSALPHIERALALPSLDGLTPAYLRLDPIWDKIRGDPRFQQLAEAK